MTPRPSLLPACIASAFGAVQAEVGPELAAVIVAVANIAAATLLAVLGQRLRRASQDLKKPKPRVRRIKK